VLRYRRRQRTTWRGKDGGYEVQIEGAWVPVPPEVILYNSGNPTGEAIVFYRLEWDIGRDGLYSAIGHPIIRCFVPGDGA